jgi:hypothetical protein
MKITSFVRLGGGLVELLNEMKQFGVQKKS